MPIIKVGSNDYKDYLKERFELERMTLQKDKYAVEINKIKQGDILFFECSTSDEKLLLAILKESIANILSDLIINHLELDFLYKILNINCSHLQEGEEDEIIEIAVNRLNILSSQTDEEIKAKLKRKNRILLEIIDYIDFGQEIVVEGFVRFRLKNYLSELELAIKKAIKEYGIEEENKEFVHLLKEYVDKQANKVEVVNVIKVENSGFKLLNGDEKIIENPFLDDYVLEGLEEELAPEDLVISALISLAPKEVILHFDKPFELVANLKNIFVSQLSICLGCRYCKVNNLAELEEKIQTQS
ncbi:MAG: putative sporulation protein YtxC [Halanaerobacter sp.]